MESLDEVEKRVLRPVEILEDHDDGPSAASRRGTPSRRARAAPAPRADGGLHDVEAEGQPERRVVAEPLQHRVRRVRLAEAELTAQNVGERLVRDPAAVGDAATRATFGAGLPR